MEEWSAFFSFCVSGGLGRESLLRLWPWVHCLQLLSQGLGCMSIVLQHCWITLCYFLPLLDCLKHLSVPWKHHQFFPRWLEGISELVSIHWETSCLSPCSKSLNKSFSALWFPVDLCQHLHPLTQPLAYWKGPGPDSTKWKIHTFTLWLVYIPSFFSIPGAQVDIWVCVCSCGFCRKEGFCGSSFLITLLNHTWSIQNANKSRVQYFCFSPFHMHSCGCLDAYSANRQLVGWPKALGGHCMVDQRMLKLMETTISVWWLLPGGEVVRNVC